MSEQIGNQSASASEASASAVTTDADTTTRNGQDGDGLNATTDHATHSGEKYEHLLKQLTCDRCKKLMEPPIYQRLPFSSYMARPYDKICCTCYASLCNVPGKHRQPPYQIEYTRFSLNFEALTEHIFYPCDNIGCDWRMKLAAKAQHLTACEMRKVECSFCTDEIALAHYQEHALVKHTFSLISVKESADIGAAFALSKMENGQAQNFLQIFDKNIFKISCVKNDDRFTFWIQCYGSPTIAKAYKSILKIESNGWEIKKEGRVVSDLEDMPPVLSMLIETSLLEIFGLAKEKLTMVKFNITKALDGDQFENGQNSKLAPKICYAAAEC